MKKNIIIKSLILVALLSGCSDEFLDLYPLDSEVSTNFYQTEEQAFEALVAVYDALTIQSPPGMSWAPIIIVSDILTEDCFAGGSDANDGLEQQQLNTYNIPPTNGIVHSLWSKNYTGIFRANLFLEQIENIDASDDFKSRTIAEAKFLRAFFYLELVRLFENIPLLTATIKGPSEYSQVQAEPKAVYDQIALDLIEAIPDLPETLPSGELGRVTRWAAQALLARTYLFYKGVYGAELYAGEDEINAAYIVAELEDLIARSNHGLLENYEDNFKLAGEFGIESVFEISYGDNLPWWDWNYIQGGAGNLSAQMLGPRVTGSDNWNRGWSFGTVSQSLVDDMNGDPRYAFTILEEGELDGNLVKGFQHTGYYSKKYSSDAEHWGSDGQFELNRTCNHRVIRYSDVLLMAAELGAGNAQAYLDSVRARVGLPGIPVTPENIHRERRLEFALEGIRYFDVLRQGISVAQAEFTVSGVRGPLYTDDQSLYDHAFNPATKGFLPIPQAEIDLLAGEFVQNEGYN